MDPGNEENNSRQQESGKKIWTEEPRSTKHRQKYKMYMHYVTKMWMSNYTNDSEEFPADWRGSERRKQQQETVLFWQRGLDEAPQRSSTSVQASSLFMCLSYLITLPYQGVQSGMVYCVSSSLLGHFIISTSGWHCRPKQWVQLWWTWF